MASGLAGFSWNSLIDVPPARPGRPDQTYASMGNYLFDADVLADAVSKGTVDDTSRHDMGGDVIPMLAG